MKQSYQPYTHNGSLGWQSWSPCGKRSLFQIPIRNYSPFPDAPKATIRRASYKQLANKPIYGWSSWPYFGTNVREYDVMHNASWIKQSRLPITHILIDDGWTTWGDWDRYNKNAFPSGMKNNAKKLHDMGFVPGLWIAPFLVDPRSHLFKKHDSWCVRNKDGSFVEGRKITRLDYLLPYRRYILDITHPQARTYLQNVFHTIIKTWGYSFIKLDFLYARHFNPVFTSVDQPDTILRKFLLNLKKTYPTVHFAACGCPLEPAKYVVDSMRISEDTIHPQLRNIWPFNYIIHSSRIRQLEKNLKYRAKTRRYWMLDPDAFVCGKWFGLPHHSIEKLKKLIVQSKGLVFFGDNFTKLKSSEFNTYIVPMLAKR